MSTRLASDIAGLLFGSGAVDPGIWALVTASLLVLGALAIGATGSFVDAGAVQLITRPRRVALWMIVGPVATAFVFSTAVVTIIGIPLAILVALAALVVGMYGYLSVARAVASGLAGQWSSGLAGLGWTLAAVVALRMLRLIPAVGGMLHGAIVWIAFGAGMLVMVDRFRSWQARRLPDEEQFPGPVIEWEDPREGDRE